MKIIFKSAIFILLSVAFFMLQSVKEANDCESDFNTNIKNAESEYLTDLANCKDAKLSHLCINEANLYYEKQVTQAYQTFNSCYNGGKE